jgi:hypothetical protein
VICEHAPFRAMFSGDVRSATVAEEVENAANSETSMPLVPSGLLSESTRYGAGPPANTDAEGETDGVPVGDTVRDSVAVGEVVRDGEGVCDGDAPADHVAVAVDDGIATPVRLNHKGVHAAAGVAYAMPVLVRHTTAPVASTDKVMFTLFADIMKGLQRGQNAIRSTLPDERPTLTRWLLAAAP